MSVTKATTLLALGASALAYTSSHPDLVSFVVQDTAFTTILGANASATLIHNASEALFHEGAVYLAATDTLFASSNRIILPVTHADNSTSNQTIKLSAVHGVSSSNPTVENLSTETINLPNGGFLDPQTGALLWTAQGSKKETAGIYAIPDPVNAPNMSHPLVTHFYGRPFNSPNDVVTRPVATAAASTVWFTDVDYAYTQGLREAPLLRNHVYMHDVATNATRVMADGFAKPNGLAFDAAGSVLYVTDGAADAADNPQGAATIYAFDVLAAPAAEEAGGGVFLANKRLFAYAAVGIPDGVKVDAAGNVWAGTGAGVVVWSAAGVLLGEIRVEGGAANLGFGRSEKTVFVLGEKLLWRVQLG